jgi:GMP synthase (glutamine-hydrolysing)
MRRILLYKTGETAPAIVDQVGDYFRWFARLIGDLAELRVHVAFERPRADAAGFDGVIVTGSPCSLVDPEPWMHDAAGFIREVAEAGTPVLGVCFGHQLIGCAWGGSVRKNPKGWEAGTTTVELTEEGRRDPLFDGLPPTLDVNMSHRDEVCPLGPGVRHLARGGRCEYQAIAVGEHVRGVQFHPEMNGGVIQRIIRHRMDLLAEDAVATGRADEGHPDRLLARSGDTPHGEGVVTNFIRHFIDHA